MKKNSARSIPRTLNLGDLETLNKQQLKSQKSLKTNSIKSKALLKSLQSKQTKSRMSKELSVKTNDILNLINNINKLEVSEQQKQFTTIQGNEEDNKQEKAMEVVMQMLADEGIEYSEEKQAFLDQKGEVVDIDIMKCIEALLQQWRDEEKKVLVDPNYEE